MIVDSNASAYYPVLWIDEFWLLTETMTPINETVTSLNLSLDYSTISMMKWQMLTQMEQSFSMQESMGAAGEGDSDEFKVEEIYRSIYR